MENNPTITIDTFLDGIHAAVKSENLEWHRHSLERMFERNLARSEVLKTLENGKLIESYFQDHPCPSGLFLNFIYTRPIHVVAAYEKQNEKAFIITAYVADLDHFESDYCTRRKK